jgi:queuine/archaeosine tRNA-ribosyltransferase
MRILTITSCTGEKVSSPANQLTLDDFVQGGAHLKSREKELKEFALPAGEIYTGQQHVRLIRGIDAVKEVKNFKIDLHILSAGYGMIPADRVVVPYECTFATMKTKKLRQWADKLQVPQGFRETVGQKYDFGLVLLGNNYLDACAVDAKVTFGGPTLLFCGTGTAKTLPPMNHVRVVAISNPEAKRFSCGLVALKGELAARVLKGVAKDPSVVKQLMDSSFDVLAWLDQQSSEKATSSIKAVKTKVERSKPAAKQAEAGAPKSKGTVNPKVDHVIQIPQSWWDKPHKSKLRYFIPEWDDLVDPDYDFLTDTHSGGTGDWTNNVYAHQMYPEPNYDGLLMSRAIAEKGKGKKERINALGVHRMLRVPPEFPIMGDCGAFDYIMEEKPPYSTEDVLDYYTRLGFDLGVSVDHLIVTATEDQKQFRYDLTIHNAEEFLKEHRKAGLKWEPIGAVQGWDPDSYARAAAQYVKMGYKYLGLGGLVRSSTKDVLAMLERVKSKVPADVSLHLFGLARLNALPQMAKLGVRSVDSASPLRQAWFGAKDNYWASSGEHFRAIRIPEAGKSFRAKRMVTEGRAEGDFVERTELRCIELLRAYDAGKCSLETVLDKIGEYDHLITPDRPLFIEQYRHTLEAKPWKECQCDICKRDGIDVIIFRGNNRNRRRGFHNVFVFYRMLQGILNGTIKAPERARGSQLVHPELNLDL